MGLATTLDEAIDACSAEDSPASAEMELGALARLVGSFAGRRFKLAVVEAASPARRAEVLQRVREVVAPRPVLEASLSGQVVDNVWDTLRERLHGEGVLVLSGVDDREDAAYRSVLRQLNVQRDLLVRDLAVPWVVFVHPGRAPLLRDVAPDFADFVTLWLRDEPVAPPTMEPIPLSTYRPRFEVEDPRLAAAVSHAERRSVHQARDDLGRYDVAGGPRDADRWSAEAAVLVAEGRLADAVVALERAAEIRPDAATLREAASAAFELGDLRRAETLLARWEAAGCGWVEMEGVKSEPDEGDAALCVRLADLAVRRGAPEEARSLLEDAHGRFVAFGARHHAANVRARLADLALRRGDVDGALRAYQEAADVLRRLGQRRALASVLARVAALLETQGRVHEARLVDSERDALLHLLGGGVARG